MSEIDFRDSSSISDELSNKIFIRDKGICIYCKGHATEIDHVVPFLKYRGPTKSYNLVCSCKYCNDKKAHSEGEIEIAYISLGLQYLIRVGEDTTFIDKLLAMLDNHVLQSLETCQIDQTMTIEHYEYTSDRVTLELSHPALNLIERSQ